MSENKFQRVITKKGTIYVPDEAANQIREDSIDEYVKIILDKILFVEDWLTYC